MVSFEQTMGDVLERGKYNRLMGRDIDWPAVIGRLAEQFAEWLATNFNFSGGSPPFYNTSAIACFILALAVAAALAVAFFVMRSMRRRGKQEAAIASIFEELQSKRWTLEDLLAVCKEHAAKNQLREAVRYGFIALLWQLNAKGLIRLEATKSNTQLKRELSNSAPAFLPGFAEAMNAFNLAWFGHKPPNQSAFETFFTRLSGLIKEVEKREA